jgi:phage putative head morphogenesis protein, SPP1 gp7 family
MASIYDLTLQHRERLLRGEKKAASGLIDLYKTSYRDTQSRLQDLQDRIRAARAAGEEISTFWLIREQRYRALLDQIDSSLADFTARAGIDINKQVGDAAGIATEDASEALALVDPSFSRLNRTAAEIQVSSVTAPRSPIDLLLRRASVAGAAAAREALTTNLVAGVGVRQTATALRDALGVPLTKALTISRTETLRAYRTAAIQRYRDSSLITGYRWLSAKSGRSCPACLALDGRIFGLHEAFPAHVNCRCVATPFFEGMPEPLTTGREWLSRQPKQVQEDILGTEGADLYRRGLLSLDDFVETHNDPIWGVSVRAASTKQAKISAAGR